jgi:hypothetical protein
MAYQGNNLTTLSHKLHVARVAAVAATELNLATKGDFANKPAGVLDIFTKDVVTPQQSSVIAESPVNGIRFLFCGDGSEDSTFNYRLLTWGNENWPAKVVATGVGTIGTQAVNVFPHNGVATGMFWADTISITLDNWPKEIESTDTTGNNFVAELWLDGCGSRYWDMEITATSEGGKVVAVYWGYF